jgi:hypothetical protein
MIITLNTKSDLISFLEKKASGTERQYLVSEVFKNKLDKIVFVAAQLIKQFNAIPLIEVKYKFGRREKRLEIVYTSNDILHVCKITNMTEFDKDVLELDMVIKDTITNNLIDEDSIKGVILFLGDYNIDIVNGFLTNGNMVFSHYNVLNINK